MARYVLYVYWLAGCLSGWPALSAGTSPCIRLAGVVRDYASHQPLSAQLYLKTPTGRYALGNSSITGQFRVDITCESTVLIIEKPGYRPQSLSLNVGAFADAKGFTAVIIPLVAVDQRGNDRPYLQTEQTYFVQANSLEKSNTRPQHNTFTINDALTGAALPAQACFFFTRSEQKRCLTANGVGRFSIDFAEMDIVAFEVNSPGYQTYKGLFNIEQLDGRQLQHSIRLTRELTLLSIQLGRGVGSCELQPVKPDSPADARKIIVPESVPGESNVLAVSDLVPRQYRLLTFDRQHIRRGQQVITLRSGLNRVDVGVPEQPVSVSISPVPVPAPVDAVNTLDRPDSLPMLYFEQSSFELRITAEMALLQVAAYLNQHPKVNVQLAGHTDKEGDERLNRSLAEFRAKVASTFLYEHGVTVDRMELLGYGSQFPIAPSDTEENKAKNRRVAMKFIVNQTR